MHRLKAHPAALAAGIIAIIAAGCVSPPPSKPIQKQPEITAVPEETPTDSAAYEELFVDLYGGMLEELERRTKAGDSSILLIEAQSIVRIAEEMYLEGKVFLAVKLLIEVELLLSQTP